MTYGTVHGPLVRAPDSAVSPFRILCGMPAVAQLITTHLHTVQFTHCARVSPIVLVDAPQGFVLRQLEKFDSEQGATIVTTTNCCPEYVEDVWDLQPAVLLATNNLHDELVHAIVRGAQGERYRLTPGQPTVLTPIERLLLRKVACGWSNKRIAAVHNVHPKTVSNQVTVLCEKLHLPDRVAAAFYYWGRLDLLD